MFVKKYKYKNGRTFLSIVNGYKVNGVTKHEVIMKLGYLDELEKEYDNPIEYFNKQAKDIESNLSFLIKNSKLQINSSSRKNIGYMFLKNIYNELGIDSFLKSKQKDLKVSYDLNKIFSLLVISRILYPGSKKETFEGRNRFFEPFDNFSLDDVYRSLDYFNNYKEELEILLWNNTKDTYKRDASTTYYDCTH